jgi:hypothetical protein
LSVFREGVVYGAGIGPGVYDIHSPRVPGFEEMAEHACKVRNCSSSVFHVSQDPRLWFRYVGLILLSGGGSITPIGHLEDKGSS